MNLPIEDGSEEEKLRELIPGIVRGNKRAMDQFYDLSFDKLCRLTQRFIKDDDTACQVMGQTYSDFYRKGQQLLSVRYPSVVLVKMVMSLIQKFNAANGKFSLPGDSSAPLMQGQENAVSLLQAGAIIEEATNQLTGTERRVFDLHYRKKMSLAEVALELGYTEGETEYYLQLAMTTLRKIMAESDLIVGGSLSWRKPKYLITGIFRRGRKG
ncbi:RNA polymerase sigma factor [Mucilaginibacter paludis]|uniref:RNA polymerase sigma factor, sigma-70 family n=1 Tax=Mucilaginibacter paludis DSM 18603 TaxID=714943 RepID=H1YBW3_9SPHI|nr:sigma-70 family RNA polymerase sigma factor [Mucilaginibacter paludis]EHQ27041.1 RNA polymerase sigma factor, sigma-70 family [Mucilaginibacter paludis DSM 18603]